MIMMKGALLFLFAILVLANFAEAEQVVDTNGNAIVVAENYYAIPSNSSAATAVAGGGLKLVHPSRRIKENCVFDPVLQDYSEGNKGRPVRFFQQFKLTPTTLEKVTTEMLLEIVFQTVADAPCSESNTPLWSVAFDKSFPKPFVVAAGFYINVDNLLDGSFSIRKYGTGYKLVFCPDGFERGIPPDEYCYDIEAVDDANGRRLVLTPNSNNPYHIVFQKVASNK